VQNGSTKTFSKNFFVTKTMHRFIHLVVAISLKFETQNMNGCYHEFGTELQNFCDKGLLTLKTSILRFSRHITGVRTPASSGFSYDLLFSGYRHAVSCHYYPPGLQLLPQPKSITAH